MLQLQYYDGICHTVYLRTKTIIVVVFVTINIIVGIIILIIAPWS